MGKAGYLSSDHAALQATTPTIQHVSIVAPRHSLQSTDHIRGHSDLHHTDADAVNETSHEKHGNVSCPSLNGGRDNADGTNDLNRPASTQSVEDPIDDECTNHSASGEETISS